MTDSPRYHTGVLRYPDRMIGGRRQMLLVLTLIVGVLCMHALVLIGTSPAGGGHSVGHGPVAASSPIQAMPVHASAGTGDAVPASPLVAEGSDHADHGARHGSTPSAMHHVLHLCLAILAALVVVGAAALVLWRTLRPDRTSVPIGALVRRAPDRPPPPTSVRLAQLCVLRN